MNEVEVNSSESKIADIYPLSPMQQGMLFLTLEAPGTGMYVEQVSYTLRGAFDLPAFKRAWQHAATRHAVLRTSILWEDAGEPLQIVEQEVNIPFEFQNWSDLSGAEKDRRLSDLLQADRHRGFDLSRAPLFRLAVFHFGPGEYRIVFTHHHVILDGWSISVLLAEVMAAYRAFASGEVPHLPSPHPYRDYIQWIFSKDKEAAERFWRSNLAGFLEPTLLQPFQTTKAAEGYKDELRATLPDALSSSLVQLSRRYQVTLNTIVQGAWGMVLRGYTGKQDVIFGATVSGRPAELAGVETMVGLFINTLPVRIRMGGETALYEWLRGLQREQMESYGYQYARLSDIQGWSEVGSGRALFDTLVVFENYPAVAGEQAVAGGGDNGGFTVSGEESWERVNYPLALVASGSAELRLRLSYNQAVIEPSLAGRLLKQLGRLLGSMAAAPEAPVSSHGLLDEGERGALLSLGRGESAEYGEAERIEQLVAEQARRQPEALAVADERSRCSYGELEERAEGLARHLRELGVGPEELVGVLLPRSVEAVWAMLGVWKAGAAYVPLDASYPAQRVREMVRDSGMRWVISWREIEVANEVTECGMVWLEEVEEEVRECSRVKSSKREAGGKPSSVDGLAYVIYTSGSTGQPKGVGVTHRSLHNLVRWHNQEYEVTGSDRMTQVAALSFDASVWEMWPALAGGARVEVVPEGVRGDWVELGKWMKRKGITVTFMPTPVAEQFLNEVELPATVRMLGVGGDRLRRWADPNATYKLVNIYGPTETTVASNCGLVTTQGEGLPPIGKPIANTQLYVVDGEGELCPQGVIGELYIGGAGVARGYLNRAGQTAERFVPDGYGSGAGRRLYRSGDQVRWREDGELEYLGRADQQVKLRGYRIELGEVEGVVSQHGGVQQCVVVVKEIGGSAALVAYVVGEAEPRELREYLTRQLPAYMVPQRLVKLESLPLTSNGKINRQALPEPEQLAAEGEEYEGPRTATEEIMSGIWSEVLGREQVGIHDNFFELGGDSILSIQIASRAKQSGLSLTARDMFEHQTIARLSEVTGGQRTERKARQTTGEYPLTPIQEWFYEQELERPWHYNQGALLADAGVIEGRRMQEAVERVLGSHDVFRVRFGTNGAGKFCQRYEREREGARRCGRTDLRGLPETVQSGVVEAVAEQVQRSLDPEQGRVVAAMRLEGSGSGEAENSSGGWLLVVAHHLVIDGVSWRILLDEVESRYGELTAVVGAGGSSEAGPAGRRKWGGESSSYGEWAERLVAEAGSEETAGELGYWMAQEGGEELLREHELGANTVAAAASVKVEFSEEETAALLREGPRRLGAPLEEVLLLGVVEAVCEWSRQESLVVMMEGHGREPMTGVAVEQTVGWFTTIYPVRFEVRGGSVRERLRGVQERLQGVPRRGLGYGLLKYVKREAGLAGESRAGVSFNYLGQWDANLAGIFKGAAESVGESQWGGEERAAEWEVHGSVHGGRLRLAWTYSRNAHRQETMARVAERFRAVVEEVIVACNDQCQPLSPAEISDIPLSDLEWETLLATVRP